MRKFLILALITTALGQVPTTNPANTAFKPTPANPYYPALAGLRLVIAAGSFINPTTNVTVTLPQQTIFLPDNSNNYVYLVPASGVITTNTTGFPTASYPIAIAPTSGGQIGALQDVRPDVQSTAITPPLPSSTAAGQVLFSIGSGSTYITIPTLSTSTPEGFLSWNPGAVSANSCTTNTFSLFGARINTDYLAEEWPSNLPANLVGMMRISTSDVIEVRVCNPTGSPTTNAGVFLTFGAKLVR